MQQGDEDLLGTIDWKQGELTMSTLFEDYLEEQLKDEEFRKEYENCRREWEENQKEFMWNKDLWDEVFRGMAAIPHIPYDALQDVMLYTKENYTHTVAVLELLEQSKEHTAEEIMQSVSELPGFRYGKSLVNTVDQEGNAVKTYLYDRYKPETKRIEELTEADELPEGLPEDDLAPGDVPDEECPPSSPSPHVLMKMKAAAKVSKREKELFRRIIVLPGSDYPFMRNVMDYVARHPECMEGLLKHLEETDEPNAEDVLRYINARDELIEALLKGIEDVANGREMPLEEAMRIIRELREEKWRERAERKEEE